MTKIGSSLTGLSGLVSVLAVVGCATAAVITGHITGGDFLGVLAGTGLVSGTVGTAHVVGTQVNNAAASSSTSPGPAVAAGTAGNSAPPNLV